MNTGKIVRSYVSDTQGSGELYASLVAGTSEPVWMLSDQAGSTTSLATYGNSKWSIVHQPFSDYGSARNRIPSTTTVSPTMTMLNNFPTFWQGERYEAETGLYHTDGRWYSPLVGRYIEPEASGAIPGATNPYEFASGYPAEPRVREEQTHSSIFWEKYTPNRRILGASQAIIGLAETIAGVGLGWTGVGLLLAGRGLDDLQAGVRTLISGEYTKTITASLAESSASTLGASPETAAKIGFGVELASRIITPASAFASGRTVSRLNPDVGAVARATGTFIAQRATRLSARASQAVGRWMAPSSGVMADAAIGTGRLGGDVVTDATISRLANRLARNGVTIDRSDAAVALLNRRKASAAFGAAEDAKSAILYLRPDATRYEIAHELKHYADWLGNKSAYVKRGLAYKSVSGGRSYEMFAKASSTLRAERFVFDSLRKTHWPRLTPDEIKHAQDYLREVTENYNFWRKLAK